jgi:hypothetical protein
MGGAAKNCEWDAWLKPAACSVEQRRSSMPREAKDVPAGAKNSSSTAAVANVLNRPAEYVNEYFSTSGAILWSLASLNKGLLNFDKELHASFKDITYGRRIGNCPLLVMMGI